ncbi:MAG: Ku protein [Armatimonadota bacterium]|nr:Ku protein [Armatimonadota bacterium]MDR7468938.1 Ku protein [Armatimonadota bacterium]MDR7475022.1 Ku protein [Armatimonadota bacterium]
MARPIWKGYLTFGLVTIPIRILVAEDPKDVRFRLLHKSCGTPIQNRRWCPHHETIVSAEDTVRGFEYARGRFVIVTEEELESAAVETTENLTILEFVDPREIDPLYFDRSYYLAPDEGGSKAFALLRDAMREAGRVAVGKVVIREKEHLVTVRPFNGAMVMSTLFYADEVRRLEEVEELRGEVKIHPNERKMAMQLIEGLSGEFRLEEFRDEYREKLLRVLQAKAEGQAVAAAPAPRPEKVVDLMDALRRSLELARKGRPQPVRRGASRAQAAAAMRERHR